MGDRVLHVSLPIVLFNLYEEGGADGGTGSVYDVTEGKLWDLWVTSSPSSVVEVRLSLSSQTQILSLTSCVWKAVQPCASLSDHNRPSPSRAIPQRSY